MENEKLYELILNMYQDMRDGFTKVEATVNKTNLMIETEIKPNIQALFDGYLQHTQQIERLDQKVDALQTSVNNIEVKVLVNDNKLIDLSRKLASNA